MKIKMKIKCPYVESCTLHYTEFSNHAELGEHFEKYHPIRTHYYHAEKIFKIHEKIESLDNMMINDFMVANRQNVFGQIQILKSLLDNEKL